jgi:Flp pilus assembly protein TadD
LASLALLLLLGGCSLWPGGSPEHAAQVGPGDERTLLRMADRMLADAAYEPALGLYERAAAAAPNHAEPWVGKGAALAGMGEYGRAAEAYSTALRLNHENITALTGLATALMRNGQAKLALEPLAKLREVAPDDPRSYSLSGIADDLTGDHKAAQARYRDGLLKAPNQDGLVTNLALSLALSGDFQEAIEVINPLVDRADATVRLRQNLALIYGLAGMPDKAARLAAIDLDVAAVQHNLKYYAQLREMGPVVRARALLLSRTGGSTETAGRF